MEEEPQGCVRVTSSVAGEPAPIGQAASGSSPKQEVSQMSVRVGQKAPDFTAPAYYKGSFTKVTLSEYIGKWVMLCFYPGDFTFV